MKMEAVNFSLTQILLVLCLLYLFFNMKIKVCFAARNMANMLTTCLLELFCETTDGRSMFLLAAGSRQQAEKA
jgi:hypothetical protein